MDLLELLGDAQHLLIQRPMTQPDEDAGHGLEVLILSRFLPINHVLIGANYLKLSIRIKRRLAEEVAVDHQHLDFQVKVEDVVLLHRTTQRSTSISDIHVLAYMLLNTDDILEVYGHLEFLMLFILQSVVNLMI